MKKQKAVHFIYRLKSFHFSVLLQLNIPKIQIYRARERLDEELERLEQARREEEEKTTTSSEIEENKNG
jgi:hypothetical protein